jgi:folate-binding protein YgfZ
MEQAERIAAARGGAAVGPVQAPGLVALTGNDRLDFVHRMSTQDVARLPVGGAAHTAFLNVKGHVLAEGMLVVEAERVLLVVHSAAAAPLAAHLAKYVIMDDVEVADVSAEGRIVPVLGPAGRDLVRERWPAATAWENPRRGAPAVDLLSPPAEAEALRASIAAAGAVALAEDDLEVLRVLAGLPRFGADVDDARLPMEAALTTSAVSFDKGCYLGQEVVLRGTFRGQIQRGLVQLALPAGAGPGAPLRAGDRDVGEVTSVAETPEGRLGLGYLRRAHWKEGERLATTGGEAVVRRVLVVERDR